jgi:hypothetical protein
MELSAERHEFSFVSVAGVARRCVGVRSDAPWGHGLSITIFDEAGVALNKVKFHCHPEFPDFEACQARSTEQLVELVITRLASGVLDAALSSAGDNGMQLLLPAQVGEWNGGRFSDDRKAESR